MTILKDIRKTTTIELPSYDGATVEIYDGMLTKDMKEMLAIENDFDRGMFMLTKVIKSWSFVDENEKSLPVNVDTLGLLTTKDFNLIMNKVGNVVGELEAKKEQS